MNVIVIVCDTLRRDHCGPYHKGRPLNMCGHPEQPDWVVPTPNMDRLAAKGTVFENAWCGSTPCMPARRDIYTGRYEFLERGWGPLEERDLDLPTQVSGTPNESVAKMMRDGRPVSYLVTDHFHLWEKGSGNYHMGYTGFEFIRGHEADAWYTDPDEFFCPEKDKYYKTERHFRAAHFERKSEEDWFAPKVFTKASEWLSRNYKHDSFYLHIDCFDPHEPWDAPEEYVKMFDPRGYDVEEWRAMAPYDKWANNMTESEFLHFRARYAAHVTLVDKWLGKLLDKMDELGLWENTMVILTTDHGTYNGDRGRMGKRQTHEFGSVGHIPFIVYHPEYGHGERRSQLVQLVDIYPTTLNALSRLVPAERHGINLIPVLKDPAAPTRSYALAGQFGMSVTITDGEWVLHQSPVKENKPLNWYGYVLAKSMSYNLGEFINGKREVFDCDPWSEPTWLSNKKDDPGELRNVCDEYPEKLLEMQKVLKETLIRLRAPIEQLDRLGIREK